MPVCCSYVSWCSKRWGDVRDKLCCIGRNSLLLSCAILLVDSMFFSIDFALLRIKSPSAERIKTCRSSRGKLLPPGSYFRRTRYPRWATYCCPVVRRLDNAVNKLLTWLETTAVPIISLVKRAYVNSIRPPKRAWESLSKYGQEHIHTDRSLIDAPRSTVAETYEQSGIRWKHTFVF